MVCAICPFVIANDPRYCSMAAKELDELLTAPTGREIFVTKRSRYIDRNNVTGRKASPSAVVKASTVVQAMAADKVQYRKVLGNAWPIQVYKREDKALIHRASSCIPTSSVGRRSAEL